MSRLLASPRAQILVCLGLGIVGLALLAVPAGGEGRVLVPISEGHGLSALDTAGAAALAIGATWLEVLVVLRLPQLRLSPRRLFGLGLLASLGIGLVLASVFTGFFYWWAVGAGALGLAAIVLGLLVARGGNSGVV